MSKVLVFMVAYNSEKTIKESIESILNQTYKDFDFIIIDDASTDKTAAIINNYCKKDPRVKLIRSDHDYIGNLQKMIELSEGYDYIARMDADDVSLNHRLEVELKILESHPEVALITGDACNKANNKQLLFTFRRYGVISNPLKYLVQGNIVIHPTVIFRRKFLIESNLNYEGPMDYNEDYRLWIEMAKKGAKFYKSPEIVLRYNLAKFNKTQSMHNLLIKTKLLKYVQEIHPNLLDPSDSDIECMW